jgi:hypothetical protein
MIKKPIMKLLIIFYLGSCKTKIICPQVRANFIKPIPLCDISMQFNRCRCRCFSPSNWSEADDKLCSWRYPEPFRKGDYPIDYCEGMAGFFLEDIALEVKPKVKNLARINSDYCN